jgi:hypothetical protein
MKKLFILICGAIIFFSSCTKDSATSTSGNPPPGSSAYFFANTEWAGLAGTYGQYYRQPCSLHFNSDTTVTVYVLCHMFKGTDELTMDSMIGKITVIDTVTNGQTTISINFPLTNDQQVYYITDKKTLNGGPSSTALAVSTTQFTTSVELCPAIVPSVKGSTWNTDIMSGGPTDGMYEFPDISFLTFGSDGNTSYTRNGKIISYTPPDQNLLVLYKYDQVGPQLYFAGYNETTDKLLGYYGVLSPDGQTIWADTRLSLDARLPYYFQTIF